MFVSKSFAIVSGFLPTYLVEGLSFWPRMTWEESIMTSEHDTGNSSAANKWNFNWVKFIINKPRAEEKCVATRMRDPKPPLCPSSPSLSLRFFSFFFSASAY